MTTPPTFPLLDRANTIDHPHLLAALSKLRVTIETADDTRIAFLVGPTGCGKSHVADCIVREIESESIARMKADHAYLPIAYLELRLLAGQKQYSWTSFYEGVLRALKHPFPISSSLSEARNKLREAFTSRGTRIVIIDEGHHLITGHSEEGIRGQSEVIKSLSQEFKVTWIYIGTYDLNPVVRYNGQLARRGKVEHMSRYRNTPQERKTFRSILCILDKELRDFLCVSLADHEELIYCGCLGLIGVLRDWLVCAFENSVREKEKGITLNALAETERDLLTRAEILSEAKEGEKDLEITDEDRTAFALMLNDVDEDDSGQKNGNKSGHTKLPRKKTSRPGRSRKRQKTGLQN